MMRRGLAAKSSIGIFRETVPAGNYNGFNIQSFMAAQGWDGEAPAVLTIPSNVTIYRTSGTSLGSCYTGNFPNGLTIVLDGKILGHGGDGGNHRSAIDQDPLPGEPGYSGLVLACDVTVSVLNTAYICGGGGGGSASKHNFNSTGRMYGEGAGGGGGAGGGRGGSADDGALAGGLGSSTPGLSGSNGADEGGASVAGKGGGAGGSGGKESGDHATGGGGGLVVPGSGGAMSFNDATYGTLANGGSGKQPGRVGHETSNGESYSGGGGGWGADGGDFYDDRDRLVGFGGEGGKAVDLNGYTVTWISRGGATIANNVWGAIS